MRTKPLLLSALAGGALFIACAQGDLSGPAQMTATTGGMAGMPITPTGGSPATGGTAAGGMTSSGGAVSGGVSGATGGSVVAGSTAGGGTNSGGVSGASGAGGTASGGNSGSGGSAGSGGNSGNGGGLFGGASGASGSAGAVGGGGQTSTGGATASGGGPMADATFDAAYAVFKMRCSACHGPMAENFAGPDRASAFTAALIYAPEIERRIQLARGAFGAMPPNGPIAANEIAIIKTWLDTL